MLAAIHMDFAPNVRAAFEDDDDALELRLLDYFHRIRRGIQTRAARRQTIAFRIVLGIIQGVVVVNRCGPGLERNPRLGRRAAPLPAATAGAFAATDLATGSRRAGSITTATTSTAATAGRLRRPNDILRGAHVLNVWKLPD